jgi:hypothetical protein
MNGGFGVCISGPALGDAPAFEAVAAVLPTREMADRVVADLGNRVISVSVIELTEAEGQSIASIVRRAHALGSARGAMASVADVVVEALGGKLVSGSFTLNTEPGEDISMDVLGREIGTQLAREDLEEYALQRSVESSNRVLGDFDQAERTSDAINQGIDHARRSAE